MASYSLCNSISIKAAGTCKWESQHFQLLGRQITVVPTANMQVWLEFTTLPISSSSCKCQNPGTLCRVYFLPNLSAPHTFLLLCVTAQRDLFIAVFHKSKGPNPSWNLPLYFYMGKFRLNVGKEQVC